MMPIARAAELHSQIREPIKEDFVALEEDKIGDQADGTEAGAICRLSAKLATTAHEYPRMADSSRAYFVDRRAVQTEG